MMPACSARLSDIPSNIWKALGAIALLGVQITGASAAVTYTHGSVWNRAYEWRPGLTVGSTAGNPRQDIKGTPVWRYEYTEGGGGLGAATPWYLRPKNLMIWDNWNPNGTTAELLWTRADNLEPKINRYNLSHSRSQNWNSWNYNALVRWINPLGNGGLVGLSGTLRVEWGGWGTSPDVPVDVIIGFKDESAGTFTLLYSTTVNNPTPNAPNPPYPRVNIPLNIPSLQNLHVDEGDSLVISMRAQTAPSVQDSWIIMYDDVTITNEGPDTTVPPSYTMTTGMDQCSGTLTTDTSNDQKVALNCTGNLTLSNGSFKTDRDLELLVTGSFNLGSAASIKARSLTIQADSAVIGSGASLAVSQAPVVRTQSTPTVASGAVISVAGAASRPIEVAQGVASGEVLLKPQAVAATPKPQPTPSSNAKEGVGALDSAALWALAVLAAGLAFSRRSSATSRR